MRVREKKGLGKWLYSLAEPRLLNPRAGEGPGTLWKPRRAPLRARSSAYSLEFGAWSLEFGAWSLELGVLRLAFAASSLALGVWSLEFGLLIGVTS